MPKSAQSNAARRILLPHFTVTHVAEPSEEGAQRVEVPESEVSPDGCYFVKPVHIEGENVRRDGKPRWVPHQVNLFPVVLDADGIPWAEANIYLLLRLENTLYPEMSTFAAAAADLAHYRRFLNAYGIDWTVFPASKLSRPTYRYRGHLRLSFTAGEIATSTAKRRMGTVIAFYRWLIADGAMTPAHEPWKASDRFLEIKNTHGSKLTIRVTTTDLAIRAPKQDDPYAQSIDDGARLRPLPRNEQDWLAAALRSCGNPEMTLIFLVSWLTGARIQTVLTLRIRHFEASLDTAYSNEVRIPVGPGTKVDTKWSKKLVLHLPCWLYERLHVYCVSQRARRRRMKASEGDHPNQYLFLSIRGASLYQSKEEAQKFDPQADLHHAKTGQAVRQFISEKLLPTIRAQHGPDFQFRFHDLRATYGMNLTDRQLELVAAGKITLHEAREFVKIRMGHESAATTDRYLQFRQNQEQVRSARTAYESHLQDLANFATGTNGGTYV